MHSITEIKALRKGVSDEAYIKVLEELLEASFIYIEKSREIENKFIEKERNFIRERLNKLEKSWL